VATLGCIEELQKSLNRERIKGAMRRRKLDGLPIGRIPLRIDRDAVVADRLSGLSLSQTAQRHGISRTTVIRLVREAQGRRPAAVTQVPLETKQSAECAAWSTCHPENPFTMQRREIMKTYDNSGKLVNEITHFRTADGKSVTTNTTYNSYNGQPTNQNITVCFGSARSRVAALTRTNWAPRFRVLSARNAVALRCPGNRHRSRARQDHGAPYQSQDFVAFLEEVVAHCPARQQIHVILDNLSAHKTRKVGEFLQKNPRVQFHFTPTYSSLLNQVELWFGKIERDMIARGVFTSVPDLARKIKRYIRAYSANTKPIQWKYSDPKRRIRSNEFTATGH
jgi:transposase